MKPIDESPTPAHPIPIVPDSEKQNRIVWWVTGWRLALEVVAIAGLVLSYWSYELGKLTYDRSVASGVFDRADLSVHIGKTQLTSNQPNHIVLGAPVDRKSKIAYIASIPISVTNRGGKTAKNVSVITKIPEIVGISPEAFTVIKSGTIGGIDKVNHEFKVSGKDIYSIVHIEALNPEVMLDTHIRFKYSLTSGRFDNIEIKKGITTAIDLEASLKFGLAVSSEDQSIRGYALDVDMRVAPDQKSLESEVIAGMHRDLNQQRNALGQFRGLLATLSESVILGFVQPKAIKDEPPIRLYQMDFRDSMSGFATTSRPDVLRLIGFYLVLPTTLILGLAFGIRAGWRKWCIRQTQ